MRVVCLPLHPNNALRGIRAFQTAPNPSYIGAHDTSRIFGQIVKGAGNLAGNRLPRPYLVRAIPTWEYVKKGEKVNINNS
jgi:hypothetical protein